MKSVKTGWIYEGSFERSHIYIHVVSLPEQFICVSDISRSRGSICGSGVLISPPPESNRIVQYWPESKTEIILPTAVRYLTSYIHTLFIRCVEECVCTYLRSRHLKEIADFKAFREKQNKDVYGTVLSHPTLPYPIHCIPYTMR